MALAMSVASDLTVRGYNVVRKTAHDSAKSHIFPSKHQVRAAKQNCYPPAHAMTVTETSASVTLQSILDHTTERLAEAHDFLSLLDSSADEPGPSSRVHHGILEVKWALMGQHRRRYINRLLAMSIKGKPKKASSALQWYRYVSVSTSP